MRSLARGWRTADVVLVALVAAGCSVACTSAMAPSLLGAGQSDGRTFGAPIGANTLALYCNETVLEAAGVDPASVTDWASVAEALSGLKVAGKKGITFSAIGTEEGSFQFLPWFWGAGGRLTALDSPEAVAALTLWTDWLRKGYAPDSVINNTDRHSVSRQIVTCLTSSDSLLATDTTLSCIAPTRQVQAQQVAENPELRVWVDAVGAATR